MKTAYIGLYLLIQLSLFFWFGLFLFFSLYPQIPYGPKRPVYKQQAKVIKKLGHLLQWNPGSTQDIACKLQTKPKPNPMIEMWTKLCILLQEVQSFHLPCLYSSALYFMIQDCREHSTFVTSLYFDLLPFLGLYPSSPCLCKFVLLQRSEQ